MASICFENYIIVFVKQYACFAIIYMFNICGISFLLFEEHWLKLTFASFVYYMCAISYVSSPQALSPHSFKSSFLTRLITKKCHWSLDYSISFSSIDNNIMSFATLTIRLFLKTSIFKYGNILLPYKEILDCYNSLYSMTIYIY